MNDPIQLYQYNKKKKFSDQLFYIALGNVSKNTGDLGNAPEECFADLLEAFTTLFATLQEASSHFWRHC